MECPKCKNEMEGHGSNFTCDLCGVKYKIRFTCEKCGGEPEEISSCGAVSYYCSICNGLKSRKTMDKSFKEME